MSGWAIASIVGAVLAVGLVVLLVVIYKAVLRTAENARELAIALEQVRANTIVLADLEAQSAATSKLVNDASWAIQKLAEHEIETTPENEGHDRDAS
ncbi:MAG: hypothetical protein ACRD0N_01680 [Acidimicrobiales bacterium]